MADRNSLKRIYDYLGDELSKELFESRLMYAITGDDKWVFRMIETVPGGNGYLKRLREAIDHGEMVIFVRKQTAHPKSMNKAAL